MAESKPTSPISTRHSKLPKILKSAGLDGLAINPSPSLPYLTGLDFHMSERPVVLFIPLGSPAIIVLPELEAPKLDSLPPDLELQAFPYGEDPDTWAQAFKQAVRAGGLGKAKIGVEPRALRVLELRLLESAAPEAEFVSGEASIAALRMRKDEAEIAAMRQAVKIAQDSLRATLPKIKPGASEAEIAAALVQQLLRQGSSKLPFSPIVSSGPNSANPHATPTSRKLAHGDLLVIDWGANVDGYFSDITRTFAIGDAEGELVKIAQIVGEANFAGRQAAKAGTPAGQVDRLTRAVIEDAGYGEYFIHRTGHGLGRETHEEPFLRAGNPQPLEVGMTFTIEPGIYLPGRAGARVEDDIVLTPEGPESLTDLPRELVILAV
jgi:Xaa-Pro dipeptidase